MLKTWLQVKATHGAQQTSHEELTLKEDTGSFKSYIQRECNHDQDTKALISI